MDNKAKGRRKEDQTRRLLERAGYLVVKSGGSLGPFDLIAIGKTDVLLIQSKTNRAPRPAEFREMASFKAPAIAVKLVYRWNDRQADPEIIKVGDDPELYPDGRGRRNDRKRSRSNAEDE